ncbi:hypothetical protein AU210_016473 [Fusarium oxysporum f. sp. radicis-cucumerinum]|uniref:Uncharacterized protein n=1 Tax=Fusarium oxysporum f. sp. radicis-cucumerinum TaxID=327505 RepID=A0A2H3GB27_FUSOX|nr:hypothetical protein AU210_016473 [Fusarium oxysporum f. sp. radicis-cucumerinum]
MEMSGACRPIALQKEWGDREMFCPAPFYLHVVSLHSATASNQTSPSVILLAKSADISRLEVIRAQMSLNKASKKQNATNETTYQRKKNGVLKELRQMALVPWPGIEGTMNGLGLPTLKDVYTVVKRAEEEKTDVRDLFQTEAEKADAVKTGVYAMLGMSDPEPVKAGSGITIDAISGTGTEISVGSDVHHTVGPDSRVHTPSSPPPKQSQSSETARHAGLRETTSSIMRRWS